MPATQAPDLQLPVLAREVRSASLIHAEFWGAAEGISSAFLSFNGNFCRLSVDSFAFRSANPSFEDHFTIPDYPKLTFHCIYLYKFTCHSLKACKTMDKSLNLCKHSFSHILKIPPTWGCC